MTNWVYFIVGPRCVKIGTARDVEQRLYALQSASPFGLRLLGKMPGDRRLEQEFHKRWSEYRRRGEWFDLKPKLHQEIKLALGAYQKKLLNLRGS